MELAIRALSRENLQDFLYFFDNVAFEDNKDWSGCYCYYYHFSGKDEEWFTRTGKDNRDAVEKLINEGKMSGYLAYVDGKPVGWCNANEKRNFARLVSGQDSSDSTCDKICSIVCYIIAPGFRKQGIATKLLEVLCRDYSNKGFDYIEAYPRTGELTSAEHYHGPLSMYQKAGFELYKSLDHYDIVRKRL